MKFSTMIQLVVMLLVGIPMIAMSVWGYRITQWTDAVQGGELPAGVDMAGAIAGAGDMSDGGAGLLTALGAPVSPLHRLLAGRADRKRLHAAFAPELTSGRRVLLTRELPFEALLADGETPPEPVFRALYASARAPALAAPLCAELLRGLGTRCDLAAASATLQRDGTVRLEAKFDYLPGFDIGAPSEAEDARMTSRIRIEISGRAAGWLPAGEEGRAAAFARARAACAAVRAAYGNCVPASIDIDARPAGDAETIRARLVLHVHGAGLDDDAIAAAARAAI